MEGRYDSRRMTRSTSRLWCAAFALASGCSSGTSETSTAADASTDSSAPDGRDATGGDEAVADARPGDVAIAPSDARVSDADAGADDGSADAGDGCFLTTVGVPGECMTTTACAALAGTVSTPGYCPGPADIQCCTQAPNVEDNPPVPTGWVLMAQADVTPAMTTWAVDILDAPTEYPMFSTTTMAFGTLTVLARVEWHPPDFQNSTVHRGVTLYQPA